MQEIPGGPSTAAGCRFRSSVCKSSLVVQEKVTNNVNGERAEREKGGSPWSTIRYPRCLRLCRGTVSTITLAAKRGRASAPALSTPKVWARSYRVSSLPYLEPFKRLDKGPNASVSFLASVAFCITTQGTALLRYMPTQLKAAGLPRKQVFLPDNDSNTEPCTCACLNLAHAHA